MRVAAHTHAQRLACPLSITVDRRGSRPLESTRCVQRRQRLRRGPAPARATDLSDPAMLPGLLTAMTALSNALWRRASRQGFVQEVCRVFNVASTEELQVRVLSRCFDADASPRAASVNACMQV